MAPPVNSTAAPSFASNDASDANNGSVTTAQVGENSLSQIAARLGVDLQSLLAANPQIPDPNKVQAGQDIHLPPCGDINTRQDTPGGSDSGSGPTLSRAPLGDPLAKTLVQAKLDGGNTGTGPTQISGDAKQFTPYAGPGGGGGGGSIHSFASKPPDRTLHTPDAKTLGQLNDKLQAALKKAESGNETDRAEVDKIAKEIVKDYGISQDGVSGLEFNPKSDDQGDTIGKDPKTFITVGKAGLTSPQVAASTILHESNHVRRNKELADMGIHREKFGDDAEHIYSDLTEAEGYKMEIDDAKKLGTSPDYVKGAENLKQHFLNQLERDGTPKDVIDLAKAGKFDEAQKRFRQEVLKK